MGRWQFATAGQILFGRGAAADAAAIVAGFGSRVLVVTGATPGRAAWLIDGLAALGCDCATLKVGGEPDLTLVREGAETARRERSDVVVGIGGGSAIDTAKAVAALATNDGDPLDYLEVVGRGQPLGVAPLPCVAIPTTAGTGSEVTRNAVLAVPDRRVKVSLRDPRMLPRAAIVDPELTYDLPPDVTAHTGLDALTQVIEPFLSVRATPLVDALCRDGIAAPRGRCAWPAPTEATRARAKTWRSPACSAAWRWPTPASAPCTGSPARSAACSRRRTGPCARRFSPT